MQKHIRWLLLALIAVGFILFFIFDLHEVFTFAWFKKHHLQLQSMISAHYSLAIIVAMIIYILAVTLSVPGATILTITIGYLFGLFLGAVMVVIAATIGSVCIFLIVQSTLGEWLRNKATGWVSKLRVGFEKNEFNYLLFLRLVPLFPFWVLNIVPALLGMKLRTFALATFIGIIPGALVYLSVGRGLESLLAREGEPDLSIIFEHAIFLPLLALGILALVPIAVKRVMRKKG